MRRINTSAYLGPFLLLLLSMPSLPAQAPAAGTSVTVKMVEAVDSGTDPAGKQYRASVTKAVDAGNGVTIPQGAIAAVTLAKSGTGWTTQLASVTINGQVVPVASGSASVTSSAQSAAASTANAVGSILGGFGHHVNPPPAVTAVAMGQRVVLPPGVTLTFVLTQPPANSGGSTSQPIASATPAPSPESNFADSWGTSAPGPLTAMEICFSNPPPNPSDLNHKTQFLTSVFEVPVDTLRATPVIEPAFSAYLKTAYNYPQAGITCQPIWSVTDAQAAQKKIASGRDTAKLKIVDTGWRYGQPPLTQGQSGFDPLTLGPGGLDLTQHRQTTYFCALTAPGGTTMAVDMTKPNWNANMTTYVSQIFQADWDPAPVSMAYNVYIRDNDVHDLNPSADLSPRCSAQSPAMQTMQHQTEMISNKRIGHAVAVDFAYTPAQAAAANASAAAAAPRPTTSSTGGTFISCSTSGGAGIDTYITDVFQTTRPVRHMPSGGYLVDQSILDDFYAYLKSQGYNFKPGSNYGCSVGATEDAAKAAKHKRIYEGGACSNCGKIVETGWKDQ